MEYHDGKYVLTNPISDKNIREMRINMDDSDVVDFDKFLERNWGIKPPKLDDDTKDRLVTFIRFCEDIKKEDAKSLIRHITHVIE